ncbi:DUF2061 domain-containing protein [Marinobacter confluentis]|uniref:DUF2061 domain-containing protein n=1 Tax=Marinobacter confluentis TaxID=1697557 RepID=A0A4Z1BA79_9GAMM|nr:DUF2061 domain-containing protein [Marinobacter confluentis]TGN38676.1 DUF2061 domain-containing protein [Marinobacter confluentis]
MSALKHFVHSHGTKGDQSLVKTITFAITHFFVAFTVAYLLTGDILIGSLIAMVEPAINTIAYFFHEKIWARRQRNSSVASEPSAASVQCQAAACCLRGSAA